MSCRASRGPGTRLKCHFNHKYASTFPKSSLKKSEVWTEFLILFAEEEKPAAMHGGDRRNLSPAILASNFLVSFLVAVSWRIPTFTSLYPTWKVWVSKQLGKTRDTRNPKSRKGPTGPALQGSRGSSKSLWVPEVSKKQDGSTSAFPSDTLSRQSLFFKTYTQGKQEKL